MVMPARFLLVGFMLAVLACDGGSLPLEPDTGPSIRTDRSVYELRTTSSAWETTIGFTFTNPTREAAYIANCRGGYAVILQKQLAGEWVPAWGNVVLGCLSAPITIAGGESFADSIDLFAGFPGSPDHPQFQLDDPRGVYRLVLEPLRSFDPNAFPFGLPLPLALRVSDSFEIRVQN